VAIEPVKIVYEVDTSDLDSQVIRATEALDRLNAAAAKGSAPLDRLTAEEKKAAKEAAALESQLRKLEVGFAGNSKQIDRLTLAEGKASATSKNFDAMLDKLNGTAKKTSVYQDGASKSAGKMGNVFGEAGSKTAKLAGGMDLLSQGSGGAARAIADVADIGEVGVEALAALGVSGAVATAALGVLLAALLPIGGALAVMARESAEADARAQFLAAHVHDLDSANRGLETALLNASAATTGMSNEQRKLIDIQDQAEQSVEDFAKAQEKEREAAGKEIGAARTRLMQLSVLPDVLSTAIDYYGGYTSAINEANVKIEKLNDIEGKHNDIVVKTRDAQIEAANAEHKRTKGLQSHSDWLAKVNALMTEQNALATANANQFATASDAFQKAEEDALNAIIKRRDGELGAINIATRTQADALKKQFETEYVALEGNYSARETLAVDYEAAVTAIEANAQEQREAIMAANDAKKQAQFDAQVEAHKKAVDAQLQYEAKSAEESLKIRQDLAQSQAALVQGYTDVVAGALDLIVEHTKISEKEAFKIHKAGAIASATVQAAQAVLVALATPFPLTGAALVLAVATGGLEIAKIAASKPPSFRSGGIIGGDVGAGSGLPALPTMPDARLVSAEDGEGILTRRGVESAGGEAGVRDLNSGVGAQSTEVNLRLGHQTMARVFVDSLARPGPLRTATMTERGRGVTPVYRRST